MENLFSKLRRFTWIALFFGCLTVPLLAAPGADVYQGSLLSNHFLLILLLLAGLGWARKKMRRHRN
ncbi:MAG: hypothetical protein ACPGJS_10470 [Flammeovirgaceae bacterium]